MTIGTRKLWGMLLLGAAALETAACGPPTFDVGTPFAVTSTVPSAAADGVGVDVVPIVGFDRPCDMATVLSDGIQILVDGSAVDVQASARDGGQRVALILAAALPADTDVTLKVAGTVKSADSPAVALGADVSVQFHTAP